MFNLELLQQKFALMGANLRINPWAPRRSAAVAESVTLDVAEPSGFEVRVHPERARALDALVLDVRPRERHLLVMVKNDPAHPDQKSRFLCGHDERFWFVAAVPGGRASTVEQAMDALKPARVLRAQERAGVSRRDWNRRRNAGFVRQGEWFFIPEPKLVVPEFMIFRNEPLSRGNGSKPHWAELLHRRGGQTVYVSRQHPQGLNEAAYLRWTEAHPKSQSLFRPMRREPEAFVRGRIHHPDHKSLVLREWHRVVMNTESQAPGVKNVVFLD